MGTTAVSRISEIGSLGLGARGERSINGL